MDEVKKKKLAWLTNRKEALKRSNALASIVMVLMISVVLSFPVYVFFYRFMPPMFLGDLRIDPLITFIPIYAVVTYLAFKIRPWLIYSILLGSVLMMISGAIGFYGFRDMYADYKMVMYNLNESLKQTYFQKEGDEFFPKAEKFREAIDFTNSDTRSYAVNIAVKHFDAFSNSTFNRKTIQFFSVFKEIRNNWRYVYDPQENEFFSKASETIKLLKADNKFKGDCDDYTILMCACIKAVGGRVRIVRTKVQTFEKVTGHVYPEVMIGDVKDLENINYLIHEVLFEFENKDQPIYFCKDPDGTIWLNFDYSGYYPGSPYASKLRLSTLEI